MTLLEIARGLAKSCGLPVPDSVIGSTDRTWIEIAEHANATGEELARRVDWGQLTETATLTGDGTAKAHTMPAGFSRLTRGVAVMAGGSIVRPLSQPEWATLTAFEGTPRHFLLRDNVLRLWPYLASAATATAAYQTANWCDNGTAAFSSDDDGPLMDAAVFQKALEVRWRRAKGMPYADHEAELEAALADLARFNDRSRM